MKTENLTASLGLQSGQHIGFTIRHAQMFNFYVLDRQNTIVSVGQNWDDFATQNGGNETLRDDVIGRSLWDFIAGTDTKAFLNAVTFWSRCEEQTFSTQYRCDSPDEARQFMMRIVPKEDDFLLVTHQLLTTNRKSWRSSIVPIKERLEEARCSVCCHFKVGDNWIDPFTDIERAYFPKTHVVCPNCKSTAQAAMETESNGKIVQFRPRQAG